MVVLCAHPTYNHTYIYLLTLLDNFRYSKEYFISDGLVKLFPKWM
jgi:hypothetical protein